MSIIISGCKGVEIRQRGSKILGDLKYIDGLGGAGGLLRGTK